MKTFFRSFGSGPAFLVLHGLFGVSDNWVTFGKRIASDFRVIIPDLRNHGQSPHSNHFDFPAMEEDILELIEEEVPIEKVLLMGHSLGGRLAVNIALHHPELIRKLVVVDISLRKYPPRREHLELIGAMRSVDLSAVRSRQEVEEHLKERVPNQRLRQFLQKSIYWQDRNRLGWRLNLPVISENLPALFESSDLSGTFRGPVLFIRGGRSDYISDNDQPGIKEKFPDAELVTIPSAGHWVHADAPGEFFTVVSSFLKRC